MFAVFGQNLQIYGRLSLGERPSRTGALMEAQFLAQFAKFASVGNKESCVVPDLHRTFMRGKPLKAIDLRKLQVPG